MEIVKEIVEYNQTGMFYAKLLPILIGVLILILTIINIRVIIKTEKSGIKNEKIKKISIMLGVYIVATTILTIGIYVLIKTNSQYTSAKVEGEAVFQKYEDVNSNVVSAKFKGKDDKIINIQLDKTELLNQKDRIVQGDKVKIKSDKIYPLIKIEGGLDIDDNRERTYELKAGSELVKVD
ncbi:hypothetical protein [Mammaliicoccus vitulinus]|uniref:hypothetical protein n=1 Tax=Mammaliicoccus vitulinus TaxID=71237 RepID=UPI00248ADC50|nr:hypothetical protein [Mammaliicoccus vitulinus]